MKAHNLHITGSLTVSGSKAVDFTGATGGVSGSFRESDIKTALRSGTVSSSAQISDSISGSFTAASSSISTRLTTAESELDNTLVSSSAQISSDISGSFTAPSSSFSSRTTELERASSSLSTNKAGKGFAIAMSVAL